MSEVEHFIYEQEGAQREVLLYLHQLLAEQLGLSPKIRYRVPFYYNRSWICYLNPKDDDAIEIAFLRGNELSNSQGLLDSNGRKQVYGITFDTIQTIPEEALMEIIQEALLLDETIPYASKRKKK